MNTCFPFLDTYVKMPDVGSVTVVATKRLPMYKKNRGKPDIVHQIQIGRIIFVSEWLYKQAKHPLDLVSTKSI